MSSDGSSVLYTTVDKLTADDHDASADIYRADVSPGGLVTLTRVSSGSGAGDTDSCDPAAAAGRNNWNAVGAASTNSCAAVAFAGQAGVARGSGAIYFLSPERLDGTSGVQNQPNLYLSEPGQAASLRRHPGALQPRDHRRGPRQRDGRVRRLPGDAERRLRGLLLGCPPDRLPDRRTHGDLSLCGAGQFADLRLLPDHPGDAERRHRTVRIRPEPRRRRQSLLHLDRSSRSA